MVATTRPMARPAPGMRRPPGPAAARATAAHSGGEVTGRQMTQLILQGTLVGLFILAVLAIVVVFFGDALRARFASIGAVPSRAAAPATPGPTVVYRDRGDGTVVVMEIDGNGTRIKGVMNRVDVPMMKEEARSSRRWGDEAVNSQSRVNALGSAFR